MNLTKKILLLAFAFFLSTTIYAQPDPVTVDIPLDGGVSALLAAGVAFIIKKLYSSRKKETQQ